MTPTLREIMAAGVSEAKAREFEPFIQAACTTYEINTPQRVAGFLSQLAHESGGFARLEENLNYSDVGMANTWPTRFAEVNAQGQRVRGPDNRFLPNVKAKELHRKPELIANSVYANRMSNGDEASGDGWRYRGRGLKQLTGKDNYTRCGAALKLDLVGNPDLLLQPGPASLSGAWFWGTNGCNAFADRGDIDGLTRRINGGLIGIEDRRKRYNDCLAAINAK
jgi:putative chitinase